VIIFRENGVEIVFTETQMLCSVRNCDWQCNKCKYGKKAIAKYAEIKKS
jgi:hypothetical protein